MPVSTRVSLAALAVLAAVACGPDAPVHNPAADADSITIVREREMAAVISGNADSALAVYTDDVRLMPPDEPAANGSAEVRKWFEAMAANAKVTGQYTNFHIDVVGDQAIEHYTAMLTVTPKGGSPTSETIKGIHIYRRQADGSWRIAQDVWNADPPPRGAKK